MLFVSHDRELLNRIATRIATLEPGAAGATLWVHPGRFTTYADARRDRNDRLEELRRRWDEEHAKLKALVVMYRQKATYNEGMASRLQAAQTRLAKFLEAGPPEALPQRQNVRMRLAGGRTAKRSVICEQLELTAGPPAGSVVPTGGGLMKPFDLEVWYGERVAVLGSNGSGKSHFLRVLAAGGSDPDNQHQPVGDVVAAPSRTGVARLGSRCGRWLARTHGHPALLGRTLLEVLHRGTSIGPASPARRRPAHWTATSWPAPRADLRVAVRRSQARFQILCSSCPAPHCSCSTSRRTISTWTTAEALEEGLDAFEGT